MRLLFDAHLDLAWNAVSFNRDLTLPLAEVREREAALTDVPGRGRGAVTLPELRRAGVVVCLATLLARSGPVAPTPPPFRRTDLDYAAPAIAHAVAHGQLAYYRLLETRGHLRFLYSATDLDDHWDAWQRTGGEGQPLGILLSMEGTDPITTPDEAEAWWAAGLRAAGLAHYGRSRHAYGTGVNGPLSDEGRALLRAFERLGIALDVTHLCDESMADALDAFDGPVLASHHNCRSLVFHDRQLSDDQIRRLIDRDAVIGAALDAWMLYPGWVRGETSPSVVGLDAVADHIDHVCQIAGNARHAAIGTDLDGGYGTEQTPQDLDTIADVQKIPPLLRDRGYTEADIAAIMHGNWLRLLERTLPAV